MSTSQIISIVPRLPPAIDGIGDYSLKVAQQLRKDFGIHTHFIVSNPLWVGDNNIDGFPVTKVSHREPKALLDLLNEAKGANAVLLQYASHGHAKKGCPFWLVDALEKQKSKKMLPHLAIMFHEIYSMGPGVVPWNTDFWLLPWQKEITRRLANISDQNLTSSEKYAKLLSVQTGIPLSSIETLPIPSTIGEPHRILPLNARHKRIVIFGQAGNKRNVYQQLDRLSAFFKYLGIEEILDIGPRVENTIERLIDIPVKTIGEISPSEISEILQNSMVGVLAYDSLRLAKSSIFAAYCSHGIFPINMTSCGISIDGLQEVKHYYTADLLKNLQYSRCNLQEVADNAQDWYSKHNYSATAKVFHKALSKESTNAVNAKFIHV
jgi:hypothetical protein